MGNETFYGDGLSAGSPANSAPMRFGEWRPVISDIVMDKAVLFHAILGKVPDRFA